MKRVPLFVVLTVFVLTVATLQAQVPASCATPTFGPGLPYRVGTDSVPLAATDLDGNGSIDLITGSWPGLSILLNNGDGTFAPARFFPIARGVSLLVPGDVNGDGKPDLAGLNPFGAFVLIGDGAGGFSVGSTFAVANNPVGVAIGDFNGDGHPDLAVSTQIPGEILVRAGDGAGGFGAPVVLETTNRPILGSLIAADFNHDGRLDLAVAGATDTVGTVEVRLGNGDGTFLAAATFPVGTYPERIAPADFNRDGHLDLAVLNGEVGGNTLSLLMGDGTGAFAPQAVFPVIDSSAMDLDVSDFNGDGYVDVAVSAYYTHTLPNGNVSSGIIDVLPGNGSGGFGEPLRLPVWGNGGGESIIADFDGDGKADLAGVNNDYVDGELYVFRNMCGSVIDLSTTVSVAKPLIINRPTVYTIAVENRGPDPAPAVSVDLDVSPAPTLQLWSLTPTGGTCRRIRDQLYSCILNNVVPGETRLVKLTANPNQLTVATVMAQATAGGEDPTPNDQSATDSTLIQTLGGAGILLRAPDSGGVELQWTGGDAQSGYYVVRRVGASNTVLPGVGTPLAATATSFIDPAPVPGSTNCYVVVPLDASGAFLGRSDMPCLQPLTASPSAAPSNPTLQFTFNQGLPAVRLTWGAVAGATGYIVRIFVADGTKSWQGTTGTTVVPFIFSPSTCYVVFAMDGSNPMGNSQTLCAVTGIGNVPF